MQPGCTVCEGRVGRERDIHLRLLRFCVSLSWQSGRGANGVGEKAEGKTSKGGRHDPALEVRAGGRSYVGLR